MRMIHIITIEVYQDYGFERSVIMRTKNAAGTTNNVLTFEKYDSILNKLMHLTNTYHVYAYSARERVSKKTTIIRYTFQWEVIH